MEGSKSAEGANTASATENAAAASTSATTATEQTGAGSGESSPNPETAPPTLNQVRYPCLMNMDYHAAREAFLDQAHRWLMFAVIAAGASAFVDVWSDMRLWGPILAVVAGALDLTFDLSNRARAHAMFRRRYAEILGNASREPDKLVALQCKLDEIAGEEEPPFNALLALSAMRAQQQTYGKVTDPCRPGLYYRVLKNFRRFPGHDFNEK